LKHNLSYLYFEKYLDIMRILSTLIFLACFASVTSAQNNSGEIIYLDKINLHKNLPPEREAMKDRIPEFRESKKVLLFNDQAALYKTKPKTEAEKKEQQEFRGEGRRRRGGRFGGRNNNNQYYTSISNGIFVDSRNLFGRDFLIEGKRSPLKWKITGEQKQVGDYLCQKATYQDTSQKIVAWFTPMIPVPAGPNQYNGLPGMILHMDFDEGSRQITAIDISLKTIEADAIVQPTEGKKVSDDEFKKIRAEKMKEREEEFGGQGRGRFRRFGG
jgi:GLPGLI family protein